MTYVRTTSGTIRHVFAGLPDGVRLFAWVRAIRWFGWGFGEPLLPVFIMAFSHTFVEAGLFSSAVEIVSLLSLPIIGVWTDRFSARRLVLWSLILYPLVGLSYLASGIFGLATFVVIARCINGFTWELENVGIATYYRRALNGKKIATSFGYLDTWTNLAWIAAALMGMFLVSVMPIHYLLFAIAPFSLVAYFVALKAPNDQLTTGIEACTPMLPPNEPIVGTRSSTHRLWLLGGFVLFSSIISSLATFFIPIAAYLEGANLPMVVLIAVLGAAPSLFGFLLGHVADHHNRYALISLGLSFVVIVTLCLSAIHFYWFKICAVFVLGIILELFHVVQNSLITTLGPVNTSGKRASAFEIISTVGDLVAPITLGVTLDVFGFARMMLMMGTIAMTLAFIFHLKKPDGVLR